MVAGSRPRAPAAPDQDRPPRRPPRRTRTRCSLAPLSFRGKLSRMQEAHPLLNPCLVVGLFHHRLAAATLVARATARRRYRRLALAAAAPPALAAATSRLAAGWAVPQAQRLQPPAAPAPALMLV
jgi:hypothetical protein